MKRLYYDLNTRPEENSPLLHAYAELGWSGICAVQDFGLRQHPGAGAAETKNRCIQADTQGALIFPGKPEDVQPMARQALKHSDLVFVSGGDEEINRAASMCWEVDVLCHPERVTGKDPLDQKNSGVDDVMARLMAEHGTAIEICLAELLSCYGAARAQVIGRMRQNIMLAKNTGHLWS